MSTAQVWQRVRAWWQGTREPVRLSPADVEARMAQRTPYQQALDRLGDLQDLGCERGLSVQEQAEYARLDAEVTAYERARTGLQERLRDVQQELSAYGSWNNEQAQTLRVERWALQDALQALESGMHLANPPQLTDTQVQALEAYAGQVQGLVQALEADAVQREIQQEPAFFYMDDADYDAWRAGDEHQAAQVEHTIRNGIVAQGHTGVVTVLTPYGDVACSFLIRAQEAQQVRQAAWDALSPEEQAARDQEAYESRGSDPRVDEAQERLFAQQREEGEWIGWHDPSQSLEHPDWFLTPYREGNHVRYEMSEAVYDEWRLASPDARPTVEQTIQAVAERDNGPGEYTVLTPHGDAAFTFAVQGVHQQQCDVDYPTQYAGMGSAPDRIEIDTNDTEMGQRWEGQLAALTARLEQLEQGHDPHQQHQQRY